MNPKEYTRSLILQRYLDIELAINYIILRMRIVWKFASSARNSIIRFYCNSSIIRYNYKVSHMRWRYEYSNIRLSGSACYQVSRTNRFNRERRLKNRVTNTVNAISRVSLAASPSILTILLQNRLSNETNYLTTSCVTALTTLTGP